MFQICQKLIRGFCIVSVLSYLRLAAPLAERLSLFGSVRNFSAGFAAVLCGKALPFRWLLSFIWAAQPPEP
jgi:hypothetical protein